MAQYLLSVWAVIWPGLWVAPLAAVQAESEQAEKEPQRELIRTQRTALADEAGRTVLPQS